MYPMSKITRIYWITNYIFKICLGYLFISILLHFYLLKEPEIPSTHHLHEGTTIYNAHVGEHVEIREVRSKKNRWAVPKNCGVFVHVAMTNVYRNHVSTAVSYTNTTQS